MGDTLLREKGSVMMENVEEVKRKCKGKESRFGKRYGFELKLRWVKLRLEEGLPELASGIDPVEYLWQHFDQILNLR